MEDGDDDIFNPFLADDDALPSSSASAKKPLSKPGRRFLPKGSKVPKPEPSSDPVPSVPHKAPEKPRDDNLPALLPTVEKPEAVSLDGGFVAIEKEAVDEAEPMDVDEVPGEDEVVREIDVFFNPSLGNGAQLFLIQYPLRPSWRPYGLDRRCKQVRMKPKQTELEFGLAVDVYNENYDNDVEEQLKIPLQTLSGLRVPLVTSYAVGILKGNELHLNPVHAAVELRPSLKHVKSAYAKNVVETTECKTEISSTINKGKQKLEQVPENEALAECEDWISIDFHPFESQLSSRYRQKLLSEENKDIHFSMLQHNYLSNLCPGPAADSKRNKGPSKRILLSLPLDERLKLWFTQGGQVHQFSALLHLAGSESTEDVLKLLPKYAHLVQGLWVSKSSLLYENREAAYREYVLFLFSTSTAVPADKIPNDLENVIMPPLARKRTCFNDWKFLEPPDHTFMKCHPEVVAEQEYIWSSREKTIMNALGEVGRAGRASRMDMLERLRASGAGSSRTVDASSINGKDSNEKANIIISGQARAALLKAIPKVFDRHRVCRISTICQHLRDMALSESQLQKRDPSASIVAAISFIDRPDVLREIIGQVALQIHDVFVLKSAGNPSVDPFRNVVINLLRCSRRDTKLKKEQILIAAKSALKTEISDTYYKMVLGELCDHKGGGWVLKSGDGKPD